MKLSDLNVNIDGTDVAVLELKELKEYFQNNLKQIEETGEPSGYSSWESIEDDLEAIKKDLSAINTVLSLLEY